MDFVAESFGHVGEEDCGPANDVVLFQTRLSTASGSEAMCSQRLGLVREAGPLAMFFDVSDLCGRFVGVSFVDAAIFIDGVIKLEQVQSGFEIGNRARRTKTDECFSSPLASMNRAPQGTRTCRCRPDPCLAWRVKPVLQPLSRVADVSTNSADIIDVGHEVVCN